MSILKTSLKHEVSVIGICLLTWITSAASVNAKPDCAFPLEQSGTIKAVLNDGIIILNSNKQLKLSNVKLTKQAIANLKILKGHNIYFYQSGRPKDRYKRELVQVVIKQNQKKIWLQQDLISKGLALALATPQNKTCLMPLLKAEAKARYQQRGEWAANRSLKVISASDLNSLNAIPQGQFVIVKGKVLSVGQSSLNIFLNFSNNWKKDFTVLIEKRLVKRKSLNWSNLKSIKDQDILIRGWLDHWNGPMIKVEIPEMIERQPQKTANTSK